MAAHITLAAPGLQHCLLGVSEHRQCYIPETPWLVPGSALSKPRQEACVWSQGPLCPSPGKSPVSLEDVSVPPKSFVVGELPTECWGTSHEGCTQELCAVAAVGSA